MTQACAHAAYDVSPSVLMQPANSLPIESGLRSHKFSTDVGEFRASFPDTSWSSSTETGSLITAVVKAASAASAVNWDGEGGLPVQQRTILNAIALLGALSHDVALPSLEPHPDGEMGFEWYIDRNRVMTLSIGASGMISYAASIGVERIRGREFLRGALPESIAVALAKVFER